MKIILGCVFVLVSSPLVGCCSFDKDTLADEIVGKQSAFDIISGKVDRWNKVVFNASIQPDSDIESVLAQVQAALILGDTTKATKLFGQLPEKRSGLENLRIVQIRRVVELAAWFAGERPALVHGVFNSGLVGQRGIFWKHILDWAKSKAAEKSLIPDMFRLKLAGNKTGGTRNTQLKDKGLEGADEFLLGLIKLSPMFENFDVFYALSMYYAVDGRQSLAYYARLRAWQFLDNPHSSKVLGVDELARPRMLTAPFNMFRGAVKPINSLSSQQKQGASKTLKMQQKWSTKRAIEYLNVLAECRKLGRWEISLFDSVGNKLERPAVSFIGAPDKDDTGANSRVEDTPEEPIDGSQVEQTEQVETKEKHWFDNRKKVIALIVMFMLMISVRFIVRRTRKGKNAQ